MNKDLKDVAEAFGVNEDGSNAFWKAVEDAFGYYQGSDVLNSKMKKAIASRSNPDEALQLLKAIENQCNLALGRIKKAKELK